MPVARLGRRLQHHRAARHRVFERTDDQTLAGFGGAAVARFDHLPGWLWPVSMCSSRNGKRPGERPSRPGRSNPDRILAAREQQRQLLHWPATRRMWISFGFRPVEDFFESVCLLVTLVMVFRMGRVSQCFCLSALHASPHSLLSGSSHHQRPARTSSPTLMARDAGGAADAPDVLSYSALWGRHCGCGCRPDFLSSTRQRIEFLQTVAPVVTHAGGPSAGGGLLGALPGDPGLLPASTLLATRPADVAAALAQFDGIVEALMPCSRVSRLPGRSWRG